MKSERLNIMHAALDMDIGGLQRLITDMALAMDRSRFNVEVVCFDRLGTFADRLQQAGITVTLLQKNQAHFDSGYPWRLSRFLRDKRVDVFHSHTGAFAFAAAAGWLARVPATVYTEHGRFFSDPFVRLAEDFLAGRLIHRVVAVSHDLHDYMVNRVKIPKRKMVTIINGIQTADFSPRQRPQQLQTEYSIPFDAPVLGTVGRLDGVKDQITMVDAFAMVVEKLPAARLVLVGDGPERQALESHIVKCNLQGQVILAGSQSNVPEWLALMDVFVLTSLSEGTSISLLEAMASGVPPVVTAVGGNPKIVIDNECGRLIQPRDPSGAAEAILAILTDRDKHRRLADAARHRVEEKYSLQAMIDQYLEIYETLLHRKKRYRNIELK